MFKKYVHYKKIQKYIGLFLIIAVVFFIATSAALSLIRDFFTDQMSEEVYKLAEGYSYIASNLSEAEHSIDELLDEKIAATASTVITSREKIDTEFLNEIAEKHSVDKIYWYNPEGEIILSKDAEYIGWKVYEGHPVQNFLEKNKDSFIEDIRKDSESDRLYKYGYMKAEDGYFVQVGVSADRIYELSENLSLESLTNHINDRDYIKRAYFTRKLPNIDESKYEKVFRDKSGKIEGDGQNSRKVSSSSYRYFEKTYEDGEIHEIAFPIYTYGELVGYLNIVHSMSETEDTIRRVSIIGSIAIVLVLGTLSSAAIYMHERKDELEKLLYYDTLTDLPNKKQLSDVLNTVFKRNSADKSALILINISKFKNINSVFGYDIGDEVLVETVERIRSVVFEKNSLYRLSDDRFVLYIEHCQREDTPSIVCEKLTECFKKEFKIGDVSKNINIRMGVLNLDNYYENFSQAMRDLSIVIENANSLHKSSYCFFDSSMKEMLIREEQIERVLKEAIANQDTETVYLEYQPQVDMQSGKVIGFEALARMKTDALGYVPPIEFIRIAEERQLIIHLGRQIMETACKFLKSLENSGYEDISVAVNLSDIQIMWDDLIPTVKSIIDKTGVKPSNLEFEITESIFDDNYDEINSILKEFRSQGIKISIDDFGTGYSSLSKIRELNVDILKIDKSFTDKIIQEENAIMEDMISLAHKIKLTVVVEGVESEQQRNYLVNKNCDVAQGYFFGKPLSESDAVALLK